MTSAERCKKLFQKIRQKQGKNTKFDEICSLLEMHGWTFNRVAKNNHYLYIHQDYIGTVNIPKPHKGDVKATYCRNAIQAIGEVADYE